MRRQALLLLLGAVPAAAVSVKTFLTWGVLIEIVASVLVFLMAVYGEQSLFLLAGNLLCTVGNVLWILVLEEVGQGANQTYEYVFAGLAVLNFVGLVVEARKYARRAGRRRRAPPSEPEAEGEGAKGKAKGKVAKAKAKAKAKPKPKGKRKKNN